MILGVIFFVLISVGMAVLAEVARRDTIHGSSEPYGLCVFITCAFAAVSVGSLVLAVIAATRV